MGKPVTGQLVIELQHAENLKKADVFGQSDPYVIVCLDEKRVAKSSTIFENLNPVWDQFFVIDLDSPSGYSSLSFDCLDYDPLTPDDFLGRISIPFEEILKGKRMQINTPLGPRKGHSKTYVGGTLFAKVKYYSKEKLEAKSWRVEAVPFPSRRRNKITLFQDAHTGEDAPLICDFDNKTAIKTKDCEHQFEKKTVAETTEAKHHFLKLKKGKKPEPTSTSTSTTTDHSHSHPHPNALTPLAPRVQNVWEEIYRSVTEAQHFIYITGWSVYTEIPFIRRPTTVQVPGWDTKWTIGEILKEKARKGVTVNIMVWNEKTSVSVGGIKVLAGMMGTHDEETREYFKDTAVNVELVYRDGSVNSYVWSHHQKSIILDTAGPGGKRQVIAYMGGLDITEGRWDTPKHCLYRTLLHEHKGDFHQPWNIPATVGPRQPWHDIHCKIEGPTALDVFVNFEQRWKKQVADKVEALFKFDNSLWFQVPYSTLPEEEEDDDHPDADATSTAGGWRAQFFRSIDSTSAIIPNVDASIQAAYIHTIRNAKRFLYIENQYFMGSSFAWLTNSDAGCKNRVPFEIVTRITSAISKHRPFGVVVVMPLFPEGDPHDAGVQEMLKWQYTTMTMMYARIGEAIAAAGLKTHPQDYLNFFCLGNRELLNAQEEAILQEQIRNLPDTPHVDTRMLSEEGLQESQHHPGKKKKFRLFHQTKAAALSSIHLKTGDAVDSDVKTEPEFQLSTLTASRRYMVYVHSKMLIADDEYIILGSANLNERSLAGDRDTEIAMGCYEERWHRTGAARGAVHKFRMSLWAEHTHKCVPQFLTPEAPATAKLLNELAEENWQKFVSPQVVEMTGHLMPYPIVISQDGKVSTRLQYFPDTKALISGSSKLVIPDFITT